MDEKSLRDSYRSLILQTTKRLQTYVENNSFDHIKYLVGEYVNDEAVLSRIQTLDDLIKELESTGELGPRNTRIFRLFAEGLELKDLEEKIDQHESRRRSYAQSTVLNLKATLKTREAKVILVGVAVIGLIRWKPTIMRSLQDAFPAAIQIIDLLRGSICFVIETSSLSALRELWESYESGSLRKKLEKVINGVPELKKLSNGEEIDVELTLGREEYNKAYEELLDVSKQVEQESVIAGSSGKMHSLQRDFIFSKRFLCRSGRRPDEEPEERLDVSSILEEQTEKQKKKQEQEKMLFDSIKRNDINQIEKLINDGLDVKEAVEGPAKRSVMHCLAEVKCEGPIKKEDLRQMFKLFFKHGCSVNSQDKLYGNTPLKLASEKGNIPILECLLECGAKPSIMIKDKYTEDTPLHWAAKKGMTNAVEILLRNGAHINDQNKAYQTPLHLAVENKELGVVHLLLGRGADKDLKDKKDAATPLDIAERLNFQEIARRLTLEEHDVGDAGAGTIVFPLPSQQLAVFPLPSLQPAAVPPTVINVNIQKGAQVDTMMIGDHNRIYNPASPGPSPTSPIPTGLSSLSSTDTRITQSVEESGADSKAQNKTTVHQPPPIQESDADSKARFKATVLQPTAPTEESDDSKEANL